MIALLAALMPAQAGELDVSLFPRPLTATAPALDDLAAWEARFTEVERMNTTRVIGEVTIAAGVVVILAGGITYVLSGFEADLVGGGLVITGLAAMGVGGGMHVGSSIHASNQLGQTPSMGYVGMAFLLTSPLTLVGYPIGLFFSELQSRQNNQLNQRLWVQSRKQQAHLELKLTPTANGLALTGRF